MGYHFQTKALNSDGGIEKKILIVDDEPDVRNLLSACLEVYGFCVDTAADGVDAIDKIKVRKPDLILVDMHMPRRSGLRLLQTLQKNDQWLNIPIIILAAQARNQFGNIEIKGFNPFTAGNCPEYITGKRVTPAYMVKIIGNLLNVKVDIVETEDISQGDEHETVIRLKDYTEDAHAS